MTAATRTIAGQADVRAPVLVASCDQDARRNPCVTKDATGTRRRLRALRCMGWSAEALAPRLDATEAAVEVITRSTPFDRRKVTPAFAALVAAAYDELWDVTGDPELAKRTRSRPHYAPPMAWDDNPGDPHFIDDPACPVSDWRPPRGGYPRRLADRPADVAEMLGWGLTADEIAGRFGVHPETVDRIRRSLARRAVAS